MTINRINCKKCGATRFVDETDEHAKFRCESCENAELRAEVAAQREVIVSTDDLVAQRDGEIRKLRADLAEAVGLLMDLTGACVFDENGRCDQLGVAGDTLPEDMARARTFLSRMDKTNCPHISTSGDDMSEHINGDSPVDNRENPQNRPL